MLKILSRNYCKQVSSNRSLTEFKWFLPFQTRWLDNDCFGHMNNAVYHGIFDSVINVFLIRHCGLDIRIGSSSRVGFMVTNKCEFFGSAKYPEVYLIGMKVPKIGKTSIQYKLGMFPMKNPDNILSANMTHGYFPNDLDFKELADHFETDASCIGESAHVLVDPHAGNRPTPIPEDWKVTLSKLT